MGSDVQGQGLILSDVLHSCTKICPASMLSVIMVYPALSLGTLVDIHAQLHHSSSALVVVHQSEFRE